MTRVLAAAAVAALAGMPLLTGCTAAPDVSTVTVFAAASLTGSFDEIAAAFEEANPGVDIVLNYGGSSGLATQIAEGAPADVFASASTAQLPDGTVFATNALALAVPAGNPGDISGLADLARRELAIALCAVEVPCGAASATLLEQAGITAAVDTFEQDVKAVLTKIELGEVDAGLVYVTDVRAAGAAVEGIALPEAEPVAYPIAALSDSATATAFVAFVLSDAGQAILREAGFGAP